MRIPPVLFIFVGFLAIGASFILQLLVALGLPYIKGIYFLYINFTDASQGNAVLRVTFGIWSQCFKQGDLSQCSPTGLGYQQSFNGVENAISRFFVNKLPYVSTLKQELDQLKRGMLAGVNHEEIMNLRQQLEEGQVKMQSRLEEEEEAKVALMSRIQRLTKLILVSSKNSIPGCLSDVPSHQRNKSSFDDKSEVPQGLLSESENQNDPSSIVHSDVSSIQLNGEPLHADSAITVSSNDEMTLSDQMDLLVEQVKMLAGEIAFKTSTLKRLVEQSVDDPDGSKVQIQNLEHEIQEKKRQMRALEQRITEGGESSISSASMIEMQQTVTRLMTQCSEKDFELELKTADNRVLQEQLQNKCAENRELQEKVEVLEHQLASVTSNKLSSSENCLPEKYIEEFKKKTQSQEIENEKLKLESVHFSEEISGLHVQNQKLAEEASYAKELASAAAVELKNLAAEVTKLSLQNAKLEKELMSARELAHSKNNHSGNRKYNDGSRPGRKGRLSGWSNDVSAATSDDFESWNLDPDDLKMELHARKQREEALEAALAEKELLEDDYRKKMEEAKKREAALENDLANMWVLVAKLKKEGGDGAISDAKSEARQNSGRENAIETKTDDNEAVTIFKEDADPVDDLKKPEEICEEEPLVVRLKARMQEMKEKDLKCLGNVDTNSHMCKVCFELPTAAILLPCRHFCLCKSCSLACSECPICRTKIVDRLFAFTS